MCFIGGASFPSNSTVNRRRLANALLSAGEIRGRDASGFAYFENGLTDLHKAPVRGSQLPLKTLSKTAESFILHTRAWTHGDPAQNTNNHPVVSPGGRIALVHNGVIYNDQQARKTLGPDIAMMMPEVDTASLPAVIETFGLDSTDMLEGDAAAAWYDIDTDGTMHLARFSHSPVHYVWLVDGTFVFASTADILGEALMRADLAWWTNSYPEPFYSLGEGEYFQIEEGEVMNESTVEWGDWTGGGYWRSTTDGGKSGSIGWESDWPERDDRPAVLSSTGPSRAAKFYTIDHDGDFTDFTSHEDMLATIKWYAGLSIRDEDKITEDGDGFWINFFRDIGEIDDAGERLSWVDTPSLAAKYKTDDDDMLWVQAGASLLKSFDSVTR